LAKNEVVKNERKNSKTEGAILGSGATKNDGERIGGLGGANGNRPEPYSGTDGTSDRSSQESECRVRQNTVAPSAVPATATDDLRSTDFADAFGFGINRRDISNIRDVAVQLSDLAASISENRDSESASGKERPNTIRPITKEHAAKITAWEKQSEALSAEKYRITLKPRAEKDRNGRKLFDQNYGNTVNKSDRDAVGISEKFWTKDEITLEIAKLRTKNARGYDIYLTPIDDSKHFIVVDDMSPDKEKALLDAGIKPAIIQRSSANNKQAIVVIDRVKSPNEQKLANLLVMKLNKKFGDEKFSGVIHPFRMAGFSNKKAGKNNYLTTLEISICRQCNISMIDMQRLRDDDSLKQLESDKLKKDQSIREEIDKEYCRRLQNIEYLQSGDDVECEYRRKVRKIVGLVNKNGWKLDWSRVDFAATKELLKAGYNPYDIENAIISASPGLSDRHRDAIRYATDTVRNASMADDVSRHVAEQTQRGEHDRSLDIK
jgi:RepB DNA-primase from phage plasmid